MNLTDKQRRFAHLSLFLVGYILLDQLFKDTLFNLSGRFAAAIQQSPETLTTHFFITLSLVGNDLIIGGVLMMIYLFTANKIQALKIILYTSFTASLMGILKLIYADPRPYFKFADVQALACDQELGNPSGHAFVATVILFLITESIFQQKFTQVEMNFNLQEESNVLQIPNELAKHSLFDYKNPKSIVFYVAVFFVGLSRVYLGVHAINQIFLGWMFALYFIHIYYEFVDDYLEEKLKILIYKNFQDKNHYWKFIITYIVAYALAIIVTFIAYSISDNSINQEELKEWETVIVAKNCKFIEHKFAHYKCFLDNQPLGIIFGFMFFLHITKGDYVPYKFQLSYQQLRFSKKVLRLLVTLLTLGIPLILLKSNFNQDQKSEFVKLYFLKQTQAIVMGFLLIKLLPFVLYYTELDIEGDLLAYKENENFLDIGYKKTDLIRNEHL